MPSAPVSNAILRDPIRRRVWVLGELRLSGTSLSAIARREGVKRQAVGAALLAPSERMERLLADELGMKVHALFPERYSRDGTRTVRSNPIAALAHTHAKPNKAA